MKKRYFCNICNLTFSKPSLFILDRQSHISKGEILKKETHKKHGRQETITE